MLRLVDQAGLDHLSAQAAASPRGRKNLNLHAAEAEPSQRLLNAIEPGSYVAPHRHAELTKDESILAVRGRLLVVTFDPAGRETSRVVLEPGGVVAATVPHGTFHTLAALAPGTIFFESKAGPYRPLEPEERAAWAPAEGSPAGRGWLATLVERRS